MLGAAYSEHLWLSSLSMKYFSKNFMLENY